MLSKLLKYEIKATARIFLPLYAVLLVFAAVNKVISLLSVQQWKAPEVISMTIYVIILVGMFVMTFIVMIQRFYKNLLSEEGYLMFTLPTRPWKHVTSKLIVSMMWIAASTIVAVISILVIAFDMILTPGFFIDLSHAANEFFNLFGASGVLFILEGILTVIISLASSVLIIYASIAIGHLFNRHRVLASLGAFLALNIASQILFAIAGTIISTASFSFHISTQSDLYAMLPAIHFAIWYMVIFTGILTAGYFFVTNQILGKRLNLE